MVEFLIDILMNVQIEIEQTHRREKEAFMRKVNKFQFCLISEQIASTTHTVIIYINILRLIKYYNN